MRISAYTHDYNLDPNDVDNPYIDDIYSEKENLENQLRELQEENAWLRFSLEKYGLLDRVDAAYEKQQNRRAA